LNLLRFFAKRPSGRFTRTFLAFALVQMAILFGLIWIIAGSDRLFRSTVPIEQRLVSRNESIRKKAQQELLGLEAEAKRETAERLVASLESNDPFSRKWAAIALALIGPSAQSSIPTLLQMVSAKEKDVAQAARVALGEIGAPEPEQLPALLRTLQDPREPVRCEAASSIAKMGPAAQDAVPILLTSLRSNPALVPACFEDALASLSSSIPAVLTPLLRMVAAPNPAARRMAAARVIAKSALKTAEHIRPVLRALALENDPEIRPLLAQGLTLGEMPLPGETGVLVAAVRKARSEAVRVTAMEGVRYLPLAPEEREVVWKDLLKDPSAPMRLELARWVRQTPLAGRPVAPLLLALLKDSQPEVRRLALESLRRGGLRSQALAPVVARAQRDQDPGVRCRAAEALVDMGAYDRVATALLLNDLKGEDVNARCAADALALVGHFEPALVRALIRSLQEGDLETRSRTAFILMQLGPRAREAMPALTHAAKEQVPWAETALKAIRASIPRRK
jgi:HEAT repeat protein